MGTSSKEDRSAFSGGALLLCSCPEGREKSLTDSAAGLRGGLSSELSRAEAQLFISSNNASNRMFRFAKSRAILSHWKQAACVSKNGIPLLGVAAGLFAGFPGTLW